MDPFYTGCMVGFAVGAPVGLIGGLAMVVYLAWRVFKKTPRGRAVIGRTKDKASAEKSLH